MTNRKKIYELVLFSILSTIIIIMSFTPLGYIKTLGLEITLLIIPVAIGAILLGPIYGSMLGLLFGITSFLQCVFGMSPFGATLLSINSFYAFIVCIVPRFLVGLLTGLIYQGLSKMIKNDLFSNIISCISCALINTLLFMGLLCICYYNTEFIQSIENTLGANNLIMFVILFVGLNGIIEVLVNAIVGVMVSKVLKQVIKY